MKKMGKRKNIYVFNFFFLCGKKGRNLCCSFLFLFFYFFFVCVRDLFLQIENYIKTLLPLLFFLNFSFIFVWKKKK